MTPMEKIVSHLRIACQSGFYNGRIDTIGAKAYLDRCRTFARFNGTLLIFTRDIGYHTSGWWKNPDYERCYHLSLSFRDPLTVEFAQYDDALAKRWAKMFYRDNLCHVWVEPPYSEKGKVSDVHHYRLFCDEHWQPIHPRGEVYSKELTNSGWKSFGEIHGERAKLFKHAEGDGT